MMNNQIINQITKNMNRFGLGALMVSATIAMSTFGYTMVTSTLTSNNATAMLAEPPIMPAESEPATTFIQDEVTTQSETEQKRVRSHPKQNRRGQDGLRNR